MSSSRVLTPDELTRAQRLIHNAELNIKKPIFDEFDTAALKSAVEVRDPYFTDSQNRHFALYYGVNRLKEEYVWFRRIGSLFPGGGIELNLLKTMDQL